jgi:NADPH:quinone reductase-like Zn-dependent oxidoreductase
VKAVVQDRYGPPDVLKVEEVAQPVPDPTSVLVQVRSASVNGLDWHAVSGTPFAARLLAFGLLRPKRRIRGVDVSGVVVTVRRTDSRFKVGDAVFGLGSGSFAEFVSADEKELVAKPDGVGFDDAATLGVAACTALQALRDHGHVHPGHSVLVLGAASGVGTFAVQLAKSMGATVTAVSRGENADLLRSVGADRVVDYLTADVSRGTERFDVVLEISGRNSTKSLLRILRPGGVLVIVGTRGGMGRLLLAVLRQKLARQPIAVFIAKVTVEDLAELGDLVAQGKVKPAIDQVYPLAGVPQAMARAALHQARGKLVIHVA